MSRRPPRYTRTDTRVPYTARIRSPEGFVIVFEPVTHAAQFLDVKGEPTKERQALSLVFDREHRHHETLVLHPGPLRIAVENHTNVRTLPSVCKIGRAHV